MHAEGKKVQRNEHRRQALAAVAKVMFKVISVIFQHVEGFVFNFPPRPCTCDKLYYIFPAWS
jgi:hypothetical protein